MNSTRFLSWGTRGPAFWTFGIILILWTATVFLGTRKLLPVRAITVLAPNDLTCATDGFPHKGDPDSPIQVVFYNDFECPYGLLFTERVDSLAGLYPGKLVVYYKPRPISNEETLRFRAKAALAAHKQGKFFEMWDLLKTLTPSKDKDLLQIEIDSCAKTLGLDMNQFSADFRSKNIARTLDSVVDESTRYTVQWYPALIVNGILINGPKPMHILTEKIDQALALVNSQ